MSEFFGPFEEDRRKEQQETVLTSIQEKQMRQLMKDRTFMPRVFYSIMNSEADYQPEGDLRPAVAINGGYFKNFADDIQEKGELLAIALRTSNHGQVKYVSVANRGMGPDGQIVRPVEGFTQAEADQIAIFAQELELARLSGQLPNLSADLSRISQPKPTYGHSL